MTSTSHPPSVTPRTPGRPREFEMDEMLDKAVLVFRERGFHATSIGDLSAAVGLPTGSIYKAFKDKRAVFLAAFDRYVSVRGEQLRKRLSKGETGYDKFRIALTFYADSAQSQEGVRGCMVVGTAAGIATFDEEITTKVKTAFERNENMLRELILLGQSDGSIPSRIDAAGVARFTLCLLQGMRVVGKVGASKAQMDAVVEQALKVLQ